MKNRHFNIPIFIPNAGCPNKCIFCDQNRISGISEPPGDDEVRKIIERNLATIPKGSITEIAFFGGSFTGIPFEEQKKYLDIANEYIDGKKICGIRLSTRPDYLNSDNIKFLKEYGVTAVEIGVQSMDNDVLKKAGRGYTQNRVIKASRLIKKSGISLGHQMMIGLPGDTREKARMSAEEMISLEPDTVRIYPALVIKGTELEMLYNKGRYVPLALEEAVSWCAELFPLFEEKSIRVIKAGLHPNEGLVSGETLVSGPFHLSFRELVYSEIWRLKLKEIYNKKIKNFDKHAGIVIYVNPSEYNYAVGCKASNKKMLQAKFEKVKFKNDHSLTGRDFHVEYC